MQKILVLGLFLAAAAAGAKANDPFQKCQYWDSREHGGALDSANEACRYQPSHRAKRVSKWTGPFQNHQTYCPDPANPNQCYDSAAPDSYCAYFSCK
jgi:hypothetical protein